MNKRFWSVLIFIFITSFQTAPVLSAQIVIDSDNQFQFAQQYMDKGEYHRAIAEFERLIHFFPQDQKVPMARYLIGLCYLKAKEYVENGTVGDIAYIIMKLAQGGPASSRKGKYYLLYELETHAMDLMRHFGGDIAEVSAHMATPRIDQARDGEDVVYTSIAISMKFADERVGTLMASWDSAFAHPIEFLEICGKNGYMRVDNIVEGVSFYPHGDQTVTLWKPNIFDTGALTFDKIFENRVHAFVADMAAGREPAPTGLDGLKALQAVEAVIKSFEEKTTVKL